MAGAREEAEVTAKLASEHGVSEEAVRVVFDAIRRGGGTMAQFSHAEFGGMSQWSSGVTMVGDMFNDTLKAKLNAIAGELSRYLREHPVEHPAEHPDADRAVSYRSGSTRHAGPWWAEDLGNPSSVGSQNDMRYALFPDKHRMVIDDHGQVTAYETGDHQISGVSQAQSRDSTLTFVSQHGIVRISDLKRADVPACS